MSELNDSGEKRPLPPLPESAYPEGAQPIPVDYGNCPSCGSRHPMLHQVIDVWNTNDALCPDPFHAPPSGRPTDSEAHDG